MKLLRDDLILIPMQEKDGLIVKDPATDSTFQFGTKEAFLLQAIRTKYEVAPLLCEFNKLYNLNDDEDSFDEFLEILEKWGLLKENSNQTSNPTKNNSKVAPGEDRDSKNRDEDRVIHDTPFTSNNIHSLSSKPPEFKGINPEEMLSKNRWHLFNPEKLLSVLDLIFSPLKILVWLIPFFSIFAILAIWFNRDLVTEAIASAKLHFGIIGHLIFITFSVNLTIQLIRGLIARHHGLHVPSLGIILVFGLIPRFNVTIDFGAQLRNVPRLWLIGSALMVRLFFFGLGTTLWLSTRQSGSLISIIGAELALVSAIGFLLLANPLWNGDGYRLLTAWSGIPNLRQRAYRELLDLFRKRPKVIDFYAKNPTVLVIFALGSIVFPVALIGFMVSGIAIRLESAYHGAGVALFLFLFFYVGYHIIRKNISRKEAVNLRSPNATNQSKKFKNILSASSIPRSEDTTVVLKVQTKPKTHRRLTRLLILVVIVIVSLLPYQFETGGDATILPIQRHEIHAEMDGIIEKVYFKGGEWLKKGTVIAEMANHRQIREVRGTRAAIEAKRHDIERLRSTPSLEAMRLATEQIKIAELELKYSAEQAHRLEKLFASGTISTQSYDDARSQRDIDAQQVVERQAALDALKAQVNPSEIAMAEAESKKLEEDLIYYEEQLRRTKLRIPITGLLTTTKLMDLENKYLNEGDLFAVAEDATQVRIEIGIPEADIFYLDVGNDVKFKTWADPHIAFTGQVTEIAPEATKQSYGSVIYVIAVIPNEDQILKSGMTGYGKIDGGSSMVLIAFTRALRRFFFIEIWSWLP